MIIACPKCNTRYKVSGRKIPKGKRAEGNCRQCGEYMVVTRDGLVDESVAMNTLPVPMGYTYSRIVKVPEDVLRRNRLEAFFDDSPVAESYKVLKTQILKMTREHGLNTLLVTSAEDSDGKSLTSANLAISLAKELEHTVLLVDADLKSPSLHNLFGLRPPGSLVDALHGNGHLAERLVNPGINKLTMLLGNQAFSNSAEIMGSPAMRMLIDEMKYRYPDRYIIFDAPPVLGTADTIILSQYVDGVVLVVSHNETQGEAIQKAMDLLKEVNVIGTVLNKAPWDKRKKYIS